MKTIKNVTPLLYKFGKGLVAIGLFNIILVFVMSIVVSCEKLDTKNLSSESADKVLLSLEQVKSKLKSISVINNQKQIDGKMQKISSISSGAEIVYINISEPVSDEIRAEVSNIDNIGEMANFVYNMDAEIAYEPAPATPIGDELMAVIPKPSVDSILKPLIPISKNYLKLKGFTDKDINDMLAENKVDEIYLVPFVMALARIEKAQIEGEYNPNDVSDYSISYNQNIPNFFFNSVSARELNANDFLSCAGKALGVDALWAIGTSGLKTWTVAAMKTAFKSVLPKFIGPAGVAITVITFGWCLADKSLE